jgi:hypothetical protein
MEVLWRVVERLKFIYEWELALRGDSEKCPFEKRKPLRTLQICGEIRSVSAPTPARLKSVTTEKTTIDIFTAV